MEQVHVNIGLLGLTCSLISAKWAMELGFSQFGQILWGIAGLFLGPFILLILYVRQVGALQVKGTPGGGWWRSINPKELRHEVPSTVISRAE